MDTNTHQRLEATRWASSVLTQRGCKLYPVCHSWDVELPNGSWETADDWRDLCRLARRVQSVSRTELRLRGLVPEHLRHRETDRAV